MVLATEIVISVLIIVNHHICIEKSNIDHLVNVDCRSLFSVTHK